VKAPQRRRSLLEEGLIDAVVRQLMSGNEVMVYGFVLGLGLSNTCPRTGLTRSIGLARRAGVGQT
jgi:hypothetical protein